MVPEGDGLMAYLRGTGLYLDDLHIPDAGHAVFVRSPVAYGTLISVDVSQTMSEPGVIAAYTAQDLALPDIPGNFRADRVSPEMACAPLARDVVRYSGEPVAVVIADSGDAAVDAASLVDIDVDQLPPVVQTREAELDQSLLFPAVGTNVVLTQRTTVGDRTNARNLASVELLLEQPRVSPTPIETLGALAIPGDDELTFWCGHQSPHRLRRELSSLLGITENALQVRVPSVGGAFGQKGPFYPEYLVIASVAMALDIPVRWVQTRSENFLSGVHGRGSTAKVRISGSHDGLFEKLEVETLANAGAYPQSGSMIPLSTHSMAPGPYRFPEVDIHTKVVVTNTVPTGPYRGAGRPEAVFTLERAIDAFAREIGLDPVEVRRRNLIRPDEMPYTSATGAVYDSGDYRHAVELLVEHIDYQARREEQQGNWENGRDPVGLAVSVFLDRTGGASIELGEYASTSVSRDGIVTVRTGASDSGQGHASVWADLAASALGLLPQRVEVMAGDTAEIPRGTGTFGSRSSQAGASSVHNTAALVHTMARDLAAELLEIGVDDLESDGAGGFQVKGDPGSSIGLAELASAAIDKGDPLFAEEYYRPGAHAFPHAAHGAFVKVALDTGVVTVLDYVAVDDCGRILDLARVEGQVHGSVVQGMGQALFESVVYDETGTLLTANLASYVIPHAADVPSIRSIHTETESPTNPLGTKGIGESGTIGAPPTIVNAVIDALSPWGVKDIRMPMSPSRVWEAIHNGDSKSDGVRG